MPKERKRTVRAHAIREGDDLYYDARWWRVAEVLPPSPSFVAYKLKRGSREKGVAFFPATVVKIVRRS